MLPLRSCYHLLRPLRERFSLPALVRVCLPPTQPLRPSNTRGASFRFTMFSPWTSIEKLSTMLCRVNNSRDMQRHLEEAEGEVTFRGKIKLHGTNAGVSFEAGEGWLATQGRKRLLSPDADQNGFSAWIHENESYWRALQRRCEVLNEALCAANGWMYCREGEREKEVVRVYGEWCGRGIQKKAAICLIDSKLFCVFAVKIGTKMVVEPVEIARLLGTEVAHTGGRPEQETPRDTSGAASSTATVEVGASSREGARHVLPPLEEGVSVPEHLRVLPWQTEPFLCDVRTAVDLGTFRGIERMNGIIEAVDSQDPWVKQHFGVEGPGEGIVWYPVVKEQHQLCAGDIRCVHASVATSFMWKAKGESHLVVKTARPVQVHVQVPESVFAFLDQFLTENRFEQGLEEACGGAFESALVGEFVKWMLADVMKESEAERAASGDVLAWSKVKKMVARRASEWYRSRIRTVTDEK
eukprot:TRINITY_DN5025_c0_g1_i6.p1 TRINITY_DN5025_c0_g1~~TRINITY_DN5025_c0_g1_i6.p1  ORF type:complete len:494 (-),score=134.13 TRINITY_DN5025_c0_g1_i6:1461-2864(-)